MIYSKDDVKRMLDTLKDLQRYCPNIEYSGCSDPECCGDTGTAVMEMDSRYGEYVLGSDLTDAIKAIEESL